MEGLYEEAAFPGFTSKWRRAHHVAYFTRRLPDNLWQILKDGWVTVKGLFS